VTPGIYKANRKAVEKAAKQTTAYLKAIRETMLGREIAETFRGTLWPMRIKTPARVPARPAPGRRRGDRRTGGARSGGKKNVSARDNLLRFTSAVNR
jgi:hypothetical protein